jgi:hypothetical protein
MWFSLLKVTVDRTNELPIATDQHLSLGKWKRGFVSCETRFLQKFRVPISRRVGNGRTTAPISSIRTGWRGAGLQTKPRGQEGPTSIDWDQYSRLFT